MPDKKYVDPFKPEQPKIPGVVPKPPVDVAPAPPPVAESIQPGARPKSTALIAGFFAAILICGIAFVWRGRTKPTSYTSVAAPVEDSTALEQSAQPVQPLPVGPGPIATTAELSAPWSSKKFLFQSPLTSQTLPALVVHLPDGNYWGISLREPYGTCDLDLVEDVKKLASDYNVHSSYPMVVDPCNHTVFDLTKYGSGPTGLVRGDIVRGSAIRPPLAIEISVRGNQIYAVRSE